MKKLIIPVLVLFSVLMSFQNASARTFWRTFQVDEITSEGIILRDYNGNKFLVKKTPGQLKAGDSVRYDTVKNRLRKHPWQPAAITNITYNDITLKLSNGDTAKVKMSSEYRDQFKVGDRVKYKASEERIKK